MTFLHQYSKEETKSLFAQHVSSGKVRFFETAGIDFVLGKREGPYLWDAGGDKKLIDCHCNGGVFNLGHRNPELVSTLMQSLQELDIGNHHLISEQRAALAARLAGLTPQDISYTVFGVSGGEAIDLAIKVARGFTGRHKVVSARGGYHGHTGFALAAGDEKWYKPFGPMVPGFRQVPFNDLKALQHSLDDETAAVLLETVPATSGMQIPHSSYLAQVKELCAQNGSLLIIDEVQTGLGRTGRLWGLDHFQVSPDILVIGKGLSGGIYPITATCFRTELEMVFHQDPFIHVSTFGGAEVGCPVAMKVLEISSAPDFLEHVNKMAEFFRAGFDDLKERHRQVMVGLRQLGLMMGIEFTSAQLGPVFSKTAYDNGFLSVYASNNPAVAQFLPPLTITGKLAEELLDRVDRALTDLTKIIQRQAQHE